LEKGMGGILADTARDARDSVKSMRGSTGG